MRNSGVTKADGKAAISTDVSGKTSGDALTIIGTENFFKAAGTDGVSNLTRFKLKAKYKDANNVTQNEELSLNDPACITTYDADNTGYQPGNTYQIIGTGDRFSKLYWGTGGEANKLIFEIPIELPEQVEVSSTDYAIETFEVYADYMNEDYITDGKLTEDLDASNKSKGIEYTLNEEAKTAEVEDAADDISGEVIIPDYVKKDGNKYKVTSIGYQAFYNCASLTSVVIPDSVTSIGVSAFDGCSSLVSVEIPDSVTSIGDDAFYDCGSLGSVTIPDSVESIGDHAFYECSGLTSVKIGNGVHTVGSAAFYGLPGTGTIYVPDSKIEDAEYKAKFTNASLPGGWTFKKLSEKPAE